METIDITELMDHLSTIAEPYGIKFEYEEQSPGQVSLSISITEKPDINTAIDAMVLSIGVLAECCYQTVAQFNKDQPLAVRHQQLHMLHQLIGEQCGRKMAAAMDRTKTEIEIVH